MWEKYHQFYHSPQVWYTNLNKQGKERLTYEESSMSKSVVWTVAMALSVGVKYWGNYLELAWVGENAVFT